MKKYHIAGLIIAIALIAGIALADQITFSTYYPAPFGVYREMRIMRVAIGDTYHKAGDHPWDADGGSPEAGEIHQNADLVIESSVGIGTMEPNSQLNLYTAGPFGNIKLGYPVDIQYDGGTDKIFYFQNAASSDSSGKTVFVNSASTEILTIRNDGNVGIGTGAAGPGYKLAVQNDAEGGGALASFVNSTIGNNNYVQLYLGKDTSANNLATVSYVPNATAALSTLRLGLYGSSDTLSINGNGNVGIGTVNPGAKLEVSGAGLFAPMDVPASPQPGMIYYDQTSHVMRYYKGGSSPDWVDIGGGGASLGDWESKSAHTTYGPSATDGFVVAYTNEVQDWGSGGLRGYTDGDFSRVNSGDLSVLRVKSEDTVASFVRGFITMPVKKGHYWKVTVTTSDAYADVIYWIALGN